MALFKKSIRPIDAPLQETETALQGAFQRQENALQESFQSIGITVAQDTKQRCWNVKSAGSYKNNRHRALRTAGTAAGLAIATAAPFFTGEPQALFTIWLASLALLLVADGLHFFDRFLAFQSRAILAGAAAILDAYIVYEAITGQTLQALLILAGMTGAGGLLLIIVLNKKWLAAEQWLMTEAGQTALLTDTDNAAVRAWQGYGRRETRSLLYTLGMETTDNALDIVFRPVFIAAWLSGYERTAKYKQRLEKARSAAQEAERLRAELDAQRKEDAAIYAKLRDMEQDLKYNNMEYAALQKEFNALQARQADLLAANDELMQALESTDPPAANEHRQAQASGDLQKILDLMARGASQGQAAKALSLSASKVSRMLKDAREAGQIPEGHPAAAARPIIVKTA